MKRFKKPDRRQLLLRPTNLEDLIPWDHPARAVWEFTGRLDLVGIEGHYRAYEGEAGRTPFSPRLLLALWLYAYSDGVFSSRELESRCREHNPYIWLCGGLEPNYHTLSDFRSSYCKEFDEILAQGLAVMDHAGLIDISEIFQDGSKVLASAGASSARREKSLRRLLNGARKAVRRLGEMSDDEKAGLGRRKKAARDRAARERVERIEKALSLLPERQERRKRSDGKPEKARVSTTDPDSHKMKLGDGGFGRSYNVQTAAEGSHGVIVGVSVSNEGTDHHQLIPMVEQIEEQFGRPPDDWITDSGYYTDENLKAMKDGPTRWWCPAPDRTLTTRSRGKNVSPEFDKDKFIYDDGEDCYTCPAGKKLNRRQLSQYKGRLRAVYLCADCSGCDHKPECSPRSKHGRNIVVFPKGLEATEMELRMASERAQELKKKRSAKSEWGFAQIKSNMGWRRFQLRGIKKALGEATLVSLTHNIRIWAKWWFKQKQLAVTM
jgi:transposase